MSSPFSLYYVSGDRISVIRNHYKLEGEAIRQRESLAV